MFEAGWASEEHVASSIQRTFSETGKIFFSCNHERLANNLRSELNSLTHVNNYIS